MLSAAKRWVRPCLTLVIASLGSIYLTGVSLASTYDLFYLGFDQTGEGATISGSGSFSYAGTAASADISQLTGFTFSQTASVPDQGSSTFTYSLSNLTNFSFKEQLTPSFSINGTTLSLRTNPVGGSNPNFFPESFVVQAGGLSVGTGQTFNSFGTLLSQGSLNVVPTPGTVAGILYNNVAIPLSEAFNQTSKVGLGAGVAASAIGTGLLAFPATAPLGIEMLDLEGFLLVQSQFLGKAPGANSLTPFVDPPITLPKVSPTGPLTATMISNFSQLFQNMALEVNYIANLTQLASQIQLAASKNSDATAFIKAYDSNLNLLGQFSRQDVALLSQLKSELDAAGLHLQINQSDVQAFLQSLRTNGFPSAELTIFADLGLSPDDILKALQALNLSGVPLSLDGLFDGAISTETTIAHHVTATPLPATLPLFATGLGAIGLFGWRKKRKAAAATSVTF
jgi:hypothetical protein